MYLSDTEEIIAIFLAVIIIMGFVINTVQNIKATVAEEKEKEALKKGNAEKMKTLVKYVALKKMLQAREKEGQSQPEEKLNN